MIHTRLHLRLRILWSLAVVALMAIVFNASGSVGATAPVIKVLSNRADLISGGDALIEVVVPERFRSALDKPAGILASLWNARLNGKDVTRSFNVSGATSPKRLVGMVDGM